VEETEVDRQIISESRESIDRQIKLVRDFYSSPSKKGKEKDVHTCNDSDGDSEYMPGDSGTSEDDAKAAEIQKKFKDFKYKMRKGKVVDLDDVILETLSPDDGNCTPYADSNDEDSFEEMGSDGQVRVKSNGCPRFDKKQPKLQLGMKFSGKKQFKKAIIKYRLSQRKVINFI
jgi:alpha-galactosidase